VLGVRRKRREHDAAKLGRLGRCLAAISSRLLTASNTTDYCGAVFES
jgi:hypothetical protein